MTAGLEQRVAALERAIAGLQGSEALNPNYLNISPSGDVSAIFPGGVEMNEVTSGTYSPSSGLGWISAAGDGSIPEQIFGYMSGSAHTLVARSRPDSSNEAEILCSAELGGGAGTAVAYVNVVDGAGGSVQRTISDSSSNSSFLQLLSSSLATIAFGSGQISGSGPRLAATIAHGLGRTPKFWAVVPDDFEGVIKDASAPDATNIYAELDIFTVPASGNVTVNTGAGGWSYKWVAIG